MSLKKAEYHFCSTEINKTDMNIDRILILRRLTCSFQKVPFVTTTKTSIFKITIIQLLSMLFFFQDKYFQKN